MAHNPRMTAKTYTNRHGRKWGRGLRPYLIVPKLFFVAGFLGGLMGTLMIVYAQPVPATPAEWAGHLDLVHRAYSHLIVPCLVGAMLFGLVLLSSHFRAFIRMRWFQVKIFLVAVGVPCLHVYMYDRMQMLTRFVQEERFVEATAYRGHMASGTVAALAFGLVVLFLGRVKPRLGQDYGRTFGKRG